MINYLKQNLANIFTGANLFCGFAGIINSLHGDIVYGAYFILWAAFFDFLDGFTARKLNTSSDFGKQFDSFADLISFGLLPAVILHILLLETHTNWIEFVLFTDIPALAFVPFGIVLFAAIRLTIFNNDETQKLHFKGLPTPAVALFVASLPLILKYDLYVFRYESIYFNHIILNPWFLLLLTAFLSLMMLSRLPLLSFKMKSFKLSDNYPQYILILLFILFFIFFFFLAIPLIILIYIGFSFIFKNKSHEKSINSS